MTADPILTAAEIQHYARFEQLVASHEALRAERDRLQHFIDCADTPMMRDVLAERDAAREREKQLAEALAIFSQPTTAEFLANADRFKNQNEELDFAIYTLESVADRLGVPVAARSPRSRPAGRRNDVSLRRRVQEITVEYWHARETLPERVVVVQLILALVRAGAASSHDEQDERT